MSTISVSLPADGSAATVSQYNTPITTIVNAINGGLDNSNIASGAAIATSKLAADNGITAAMVSSAAITLGYTQITANITTVSTTVVQATGLTATVTIPAGGRRVEITAYGVIQVSAAPKAPELTIWSGTVGSGTQLQRSRQVIQNATNDTSYVCIASHVPTAGSITYNVGWLADVGGGVTATMSASAIQPAYILVKVI